jgi:1,4-dihydroxy-6-naphthoate synthase
MQLTIGISTCPNDTFAFHGLLTGAVDTEGLELRFRLADVEELNRAALNRELQAAKLSYHAALRMADRFVMLPVGSALGFGVGPVVIRGTRSNGAQPAPRVLLPGELTTAHLLWQLFHPEPAELRQVVFSDILPALERGEADLGVCIHEGRFTYSERGLELVEDLGETWETATGLPLPLGGIAVARELGEATAHSLARAIGRSLALARREPAAALATMRTHAQELDEEALWKHVELYVNDDTRCLGERARAAIRELERRARASGRVAVPDELHCLEVAP